MPRCLLIQHINFLPIVMKTSTILVLCQSILPNLFITSSVSFPFVVLFDYWFLDFLPLCSCSHSRRHSLTHDVNMTYPFQRRSQRMTQKGRKRNIDTSFIVLLTHLLLRLKSMKWPNFMLYLSCIQKQRKHTHDRLRQLQFLEIRVFFSEEGPVLKELP